MDRLSKPLRIVLVGCGQIADAHLQEIARIPAAAVVAVCDREYDLAYQAARRFGVRGIYTSVEAMLAAEQPDVVHITTPPQTHEAVSTMALRAGSHVYVEKPFAVDATEASRMLAEASAARRLVCVGLDQLWEPVWRELRELVANGALGQVVHVDSHQGYDLDGPYGRLLRSDKSHWVRRLPGGVFQNVMPHALGKITDLVWDDPLQVSAFWTSPGEPDGLPTELRVSFRGDRQTATLTFSSAGRPVQRTAKVIGTKGTVEIDFDARVLRAATRATLPGAFGRLQLAYAQYRQGSRELLQALRKFRQCELQYFAGMRALFSVFYEAVRSGSTSPTPPEAILRDTRLMDEIFGHCHATCQSERLVEVVA
jgi:predicted dehydrogenase